MKRTIVLLISVLLFVACCDEKADEPTVTIHSNNITEGALMDWNRSCVFYYEATQTLRQATWTLEVPTESGETVIVATAEATAEAPNFTLAFLGETIPNREDYLRIEASGMLDARVRLTGSFANGAPANAEFKVELPYRPANPIISVKEIIDDFVNWESDVTFEFYAKGATRYLVGLKEVGSSGILRHSVTSNTYTYNGMWLDISYEFRVIAINDFGHTEEISFPINGNENYYQ